MHNVKSKVEECGLVEGFVRLFSSVIRPQADVPRWVQGAVRLENAGPVFEEGRDSRFGVVSSDLNLHPRPALFQGAGLRAFSDSIQEDGEACESVSRSDSVVGVLLLSVAAGRPWPP